MSFAFWSPRFLQPPHLRLVVVLPPCLLIDEVPFDSGAVQPVFATFSESSCGLAVTDLPYGGLIGTCAHPMVGEPASFSIEARALVSFCKCYISSYLCG
jgi:hypothetical protein